MIHGNLRLTLTLAAILLVTPFALGDTVSQTSQHPLTAVAAALGPTEEAAVDESPWTGKLEFGAFFTDGNTDRRGGNLGLTVIRESDDWKLTGKATNTYAEENGTRTTNEQFLSLRDDFKMDAWYVFALLSFERDEFERIDLRGILALGAGRKLADDEDFKLDVELGPTLTYINYKNINDKHMMNGKGEVKDEYKDWEDEDAEYTVGARIAFHAELAVFDTAKITEDLEIFPSLEHGGEFRLISETAFMQPLSESWYFKLGIVDRYNSEASEGTKKNDVEVRLSLVFDF